MSKKRAYIRKRRSVHLRCRQKAENARKVRSRQKPVQSPESASVTFQAAATLWHRTNVARYKGATAVKYENLLRSHILPELGARQLEEINTLLLADFMNAKLHCGRLDHSGGLSSSYVRSMMLLVLDIMEFAAAEGLCPPVKTTLQTPAANRREVVILDTDALRRLETYLLAKPDITGTGILISLHTGLRISEVCALRWEDIDFRKAVLHVRSTVARVRGTDGGTATRLIIDTPKTKSSLRDIPLSRQLMAVLLPLYEKRRSEYVISDKSGFVSPRTYEYRFHRVLDRCGLPSINYSDRLIYTKGVTVFKNEDLSLKERNQWFRVDVITCAAPILFMLPHTNSAVLGDLFRSRIRNIFNAAIDNDIRVLILGAFGCGAFKNPPEIVAQAFRDVLLEEHYDTCFTDIVFAIKSSNGNDPFKPCPNLMAFQLAFDGLSTEAAKLRFSGPMWLVDDAPTPEKIRQEELSQWKTTNLYRGKQFSVLGDSVSTLESYNPPDHSVFYKGDVCSRTGVYTMADTWWGQVIDFFGGELLVNDSWSGSRVTKLPGQHELFPSGCSDQRTSHLHMRGVRPDVILVYLGTNDWANAVRPMEDGGVTDEWYSVFETAYRRMLQKLRANYPDAELWCCTLCSTYMSTDPAFVFPESVGGISIEVYNDIIRRTAVLEGGRLIDLYAYHLPYDAIDGSHPTKTGMERLAKLVLREMLGKEADAILDCRNGQHEYMALEEGTDETRYVCRCCGKLLTVKNWKLLTQKERRPIPDDSEYVMLPPDTTVVLYSDVLPLTIPSTGEKLQIKKPMVTVGRASDSDVRLSARTVARRQAAFFYEQEIWFVRDNFSTNGTWINGRKLIPGKKYQLAAYDEIGFARTEKVIFDLRNESYTPPRQETPPRPMGDFAGEKRIGEYEVIRALAPLSVKDVYLAKSSRTDRLVVLKPCRKDDRPAQKAIRELLLKEADLLRQLDHPAIPKLVEVLEDEETLCVVREYFDGETLESVMAREGTQDLIQVVDWAWQLCDVLRYLHERNYVYRDMKPGNILLRPDGRLALIDFGTMRVYKPGKAGDTVCLGTRGYAAPEQFGGMGQTDARTDIYGLGATLYYLATGCNPGVPPYEIDCIHAMYIDGFPHQLGDLIQKCVQPDPVRRFQSCRELMEALEDASFDVTTNQEKLAQWKRILRREEQS